VIFFFYFDVWLFSRSFKVLRSSFNFFFYRMEHLFKLKDKQISNKKILAMNYNQIKF